MDSTPNFGCGLECGLHSKKTGVPKTLLAALYKLISSYQEFVLSTVEARGVQSTT